MELADEYSVVELVVGLPLNLKGDETLSTVDARDFAEALGGGIRRPRADGRRAPQHGEREFSPARCGPFPAIVS